MTSRVASHPEHELEQAYIENVHRADEQARARVERRPEVAGDKFAARTARQKMLERLKEPVDLDALCFGRIDLESGPTYYLGRGAVRDENNTLLVINWRMPAASAFYTANRQDAAGLARRRRFQLDELRLLGIVEDEFGERPAGTRTPEPTLGQEIAETPIQPHVVDAILADMDRARGTEMRDIVATIEARQYELISDSIDGVLVIQGGPGSGKTAIALHRAAWLLFNHRDSLERAGVLVVGPNRAFMEYVARVLPTLGETSVVQSAIDRLPELGDVRVREIENAPLARLKGDIRMAAIVQRAAMARTRLPETDEVLSVGRTRIVLPSDRLASLAEDAWRGGRTYLAGREIFRRELVSLAQEVAGEGRGRFRSGPSPADVEMAVTGAGGPLDRIWPTVTAAEVIRDLLNSRQRLAAAAGSSLTADEQALLRRERGQLLRGEPWTAADMPLLDEADAVLRGVTSSYGYVLVDEAQDLSPMQLRMVFRRSSAGRATLVGDIAQATGPTRFPDWPDLLEAAAVDGTPRIAELAIGYRVPRQIMELAETLLRRIAPHVVVATAVRDGPEAPRLLRVDRATLPAMLVTEVADRVEGDRSVGVVAPTDDLERVRAALGEAGLSAGDVLSDGLARQVTVLSAEQAKGLEFDHVVVVDPAGIAGADADWAHVYIALTRATRTLSVLYSTPEPFEIPVLEVEPEPTSEIARPLLQEEIPIVAEAEPATVLGGLYTEALMQAKFLHAAQHRRGTTVPYLAHLQAVASLVLEDGGSEEEAIAALLHDAVEDLGAEVLNRIVDQFGLAVARIVAGCTDPESQDDTSWRDRKAQHLSDLESAGPQVRRVALAEKLDNARALLRDYRRFGERLWVQMDVDPEDLLWYNAALADLFVTERPGDMASELHDTVEKLLELVSHPVTVG
jgi:DNA helicase IV